MLSIIVAIDEKNAIGKAGGLLCHLPADLKHFRDITSGKVVIMGKNTWNSLPKKPLPSRTNIVLSGNHEEVFPGAIQVYGINDLLEKIPDDDEWFVIGGGMVYNQMLSKCDKLYITHIHHTFEDADTFFPAIDQNQWMLISSCWYKADEKNPYDYTFQEYVRKDKYGAF